MTASWTKLLKRLQAGLSPQEVNAADDHGLTPLHHASLDENVEVVVALLEAGADASAGDDEGTTALHIAATLSNVALARAVRQLFRAASRRYRIRWAHR